jgi:hypothetical protein
MFFFKDRKLSFKQNLRNNTNLDGTMSATEYPSSLSFLLKHSQLAFYLKVGAKS